MALLQVRHGVGTLCTLKFVCLSVFIICTELLSGDAFPSGQDNSKSPDPLIRLVTHPKEHVVIPINSYGLLHCEANFTDPIPPDYTYENDDAYLPNDDDFLQNDEPIDNSESLQNDHKEVTTRLCAQEVQYQWLRNGELINRENTSYIEVFCNGTIRIKHAPMATAEYRCVASTTKLDVGAVISKVSKVQTAEFAEDVENLTSKAAVGSSVVLNCPIHSIPNATIQWFFNNGSNINFEATDRHFSLNNGSLLIVNVKNEDYQKFRCWPRNEFVKESKQIQHSLEIMTNSITANKAVLLPALQEQSIYIANGRDLILHCAPTTTASGNTIRWTFTYRSNSSSPTELTTRNPNELRIAKASVEKNDGIYKCYFGDEYQTFDVTVTTPPTIHNVFNSREQGLGAFVALICNATGSPKPTVRWYHNGKLIKTDWIVSNRDEARLLIHTFEEHHKGIYQCVASNMVGEAQATGLMSLKSKQYFDAPKNLKCFPYNETAFKVTFDGPPNYRWSALTYYIASKQYPYWSTVFYQDPSLRVQNEFLVTKVPDLQPVTLYFRGMELIGTKNKGAPSTIFDYSRLSEGIKCAGNQVPVYGMVSPNQTFIWWKQLNVSSYLIQIQSDETTTFSDNIVGTTKNFTIYETWDDISPYFKHIPVVTNVYPSNEDDNGQNDKKSNTKTITELRVSGDVSGILLPNTLEIVVRVLVPLYDGNEELIQDTRYLPWKKIANATEKMTKFVHSSVGINDVSFLSNDPKLSCVRVCYKLNKEPYCKERNIDNRMVKIESLAANKTYQFFLLQCSDKDLVYNTFKIHTKNDIPGSVTNHKYYKKNGIVLEWGKPVNANGNLLHYLIQWTIENTTHSEKIDYHSEKDRNVFKFPGAQESDRFNITIRAVSDNGLGNPIFVDLRNVKEIPDEREIDASNASMQRDPRLGISVGISLSVLCIIFCIFIIVRHRKCAKSQHQHTNGNGNNALGSFQNRSPPNRTPQTGATSIAPASPAALGANCTVDVHEMQTLIISSSTENMPPPNGNGITRNLIDHINGGMNAGGNKQPSAIEFSDDENTDMSQCGLISSTPKSKHKTIITNNDHLKHTSTNFGSHTANAVNAPYQRIDEELNTSATGPNINNGLIQQMKITLPPNKTVHSICSNENQPLSKRILDDKAKITKRLSTNMSVSIPSVFDDSQQSLLPDVNATESSSASTSSGSVPMERINNKSNCLFDVNMLDNNTTPQPIVENQRYMRSAALV